MGCEDLLELDTSDVDLETLVSVLTINVGEMTGTIQRTEMNSSMAILEPCICSIRL